MSAHQQDARTATRVRAFTDRDLTVSAAADIGLRDDLYVVNSPFGTTPSDAVGCHVVRVSR